MENNTTNTTPLPSIESYFNQRAREKGYATAYEMVYCESSLSSLIQFTIDHELLVAAWQKRKDAEGASMKMKSCDKPDACKSSQCRKLDYCMKQQIIIDKQSILLSSDSELMEILKGGK